MNESDRQNFKLVEVSKLSPKDKIFDCKLRRGQKLVNWVQSVISLGYVKDFYRPIHYPTLDSHGNICYVLGNRPAFSGYSIEWWENQAKAFYPECNSRIGFIEEHLAFIGVLVKDLVRRGWDIERAWEQVYEPFGDRLGYLWNFDNFTVPDDSYICTAEMCGPFELTKQDKLIKNRDNRYFFVTDRASSFEIGHIASYHSVIDPWANIKVHSFYAWIIYDAK